MKKLLATLVLFLAAFAFHSAKAQETSSEAKALINKGSALEKAGDIAGAEQCYVQAAEMGAHSAWILAGNLYAPAVSAKPNAKKAIEYLEKGVLHDQRAAVLLGLTYYLGDGHTQPNYLKALTYLKKASEIGVASANGIVGNIYAMGGYGVAPDPDQALLWLMPAAENGDANAMYNCGLILINGTQSLDPDPQEGLNYVKKAAAKGLKAAQKWLTDKGQKW